jgi:integrase/recombinase XerD
MSGDRAVVGLGAGSAAAVASPLERAVATYLDHLAVERGVARNTLLSYRRDLGRYLAFCAARGLTDPADVTTTDVTDFLAALRTGDEVHPPLAATSAARTVVAVRGFHRFALREGLTATDPSHPVRPPQPARRLPKAIGVTEVERLLEAAGFDQTPRALRDRALLEVLYGCGARISEAVGLDIDDLDLEKGAVLLRGKGGKERLVPLGSFARDAVRAYLVRARPGFATAGRGTPALFLNTRGGRLTRQSAWSVLRSAAEKAGLPVAHLSPHTLRHSFATHLLDGGADVRVVQELLGHASVTTTQIYTMVTVDKLREVYAQSHPRALGTEARRTSA